MCPKHQKTDSADSSSTVESELRPMQLSLVLQFGGATRPIRDSGASTSKGDAGASTSIGDSGSSTSSENGSYGPAGAAAMLFIIDRADNDHLVTKVFVAREGLGNQTISAAEYRGLILGLKETIRRGYTKITVQGSSKHVVNQFLGNWEINDPELRSLCDEALELRNSFRSVSINHIDQDLIDAVAYDAFRAISLPVSVQFSYNFDLVRF
ncbi:uncharacterized protein LOC127101921 [Lathyrus oleraceus]|uniref:uncharacterized protein LOC127101921 n=1 Tax=Pisum sativum TaxID=3888 RepID=UPI0021D08DB3|nr:uncharacterized protein LOC127101921 [Pisum sativum]